MQIVRRYEKGIAEYIAGYEDDTAGMPERCPKCGCGKWYRWGKYYRYVEDAGSGSHRVPIQRARCRRCKRTLSWLPDFCLSRKAYSAEMVMRFLEMLICWGKLYDEALKRQIYRYRKQLERKLSLYITFLRGQGLEGLPEEGEHKVRRVFEVLYEQFREGTLLTRFHRDTGRHFLTR